MSVLRCLINWLFDMFSKLVGWNNFQNSWLVLTTHFVNHVFFMHMKHKTLFILFSDYNSFIHKLTLDVINNLCWKKDDWVAAVYDNEWYLGVVVKVGWILAFIIDKISWF